MIFWWNCSNLVLRELVIWIGEFVSLWEFDCSCLKHCSLCFSGILHSFVYPCMYVETRPYISWSLLFLGLWFSSSLGFAHICLIFFLHIQSHHQFGGVRLWSSLYINLGYSSFASAVHNNNFIQFIAIITACTYRGADFYILRLIIFFLCCT